MNDEIEFNFRIPPRMMNIERNIAMTEYLE
jgi:hypothetical protein